MKLTTRRGVSPFATSFSWWLAGRQRAFQPALAGLPRHREARLKPAQETKIQITGPPTQVGGNQDSCAAITLVSYEIF